MKKLMHLAIGILLVGLASLSCSDKGKILAGIRDGEELAEGSLVPFLLEQNYPNPFNPTTTIPFTIYQTMHVRLKVFTDDWQEVSTLLDKELQIPTREGEPITLPARYVVNFSAQDIPSGEYYYTMEAKGITQIRKMKLVK